MNENRGYHSNPDVITKDCWSCHGEHYGRTFQIINFDENEFDHKKSGFDLLGSHKGLPCEKCHNLNFIKIEKLKNTKNSFLGLDTECSNCHEDVHQGSLSKNCIYCHSEEKFKPAIKFTHDNTKFKLTGAHTKIECNKCHAIQIKNSKQFQNFAGINFKSCVNCHNDVHKGKFGNECKSCHNTESFLAVNLLNGFNHAKTNFPLIGKHRLAKCENCHKGSLTNKIKHNKCFDCHTDYHKGEFVKNNNRIDCNECHTENGFTPSIFTTKMHSKTEFKLTFAHVATPCISCHLIDSQWKFSIRYEKCIDCHENIHINYISDEYFNENNCESCHSTRSWQSIDFDHNRTKFELIGKHKTAACGDCYFDYIDKKSFTQEFKSLSHVCSNCHNDVHKGQFIKNENELCLSCHTFDNWNPTLFDHKNTRFALDGKHKNVECIRCHTVATIGGIKFVQYKIEDIKCKNCHS